MKPLKYKDTLIKFWYFTYKEGLVSGVYFSDVDNMRGGVGMGVEVGPDAP